MNDKLIRDVGFIRGPRFHVEDGVVMFTFGIDPNNVVGPRPATQRDKLGHATAWDAFFAENKAQVMPKTASSEPVPEPQPVSEEPVVFKRPRGRPKRA